MENVLIKNQAKQFADKMTQQSTQKVESIQADFKKLFAALNQNNPDLTGFEELGQLLNLSEDAFAVVSPSFIDELEKSFNNTGDRLLMVQAMNAAGVKLEDLRDEYAKLMDMLDTELSEVLSLQKRDFIKRMLGICYNAIAETEGIATKTISIPIELMSSDVKMPNYAHDSDAGMDIYALEDVTIAPGETKLIHTGLKVAIPLGYELQVRPKSGRCLKSKLRVANTPGTIDSGFRDEICVIIENNEQFIKYADIDENGRLYNIQFGSSYTIGAGEKFAQLVLSEVPKVIFVPVETVSNIGEDRGGGFGSTTLFDQTAREPKMVELK